VRKICVFNHKGGVGKTTTAINLAAGLSRKDKKVILVDLDPQGNVDISLKANVGCNIYDAILGSSDIHDCVVNVATNFDFVGSKESLAKMEYHLAQDNTAGAKFKEVLLGLSGYDYMIIDCPPSLGVMNQKILSFCDEVFVPAATDFLGFDALKKMPKIIEQINKHYDHDVNMTLIIPTLFDKRNKICKDMLSSMKDDFGNLVSNPIHYNSKLKEAPRKGKSIFKYASSSSGAKDYGILVDTVISMEN